MPGVAKTIVVRASCVGFLDDHPLARMVNARSGVMLVQLMVDNPQGRLLAGALLPSVSTGPRRPVMRCSYGQGALITCHNGSHVAVPDTGNRVRIRNVAVARELGNTVEFGKDVTCADRIIDSPPDGLKDGDRVYLVAAVASAVAQAPKG